MNTTEVYDWTRFQVIYYYSAPIELVFKAWTTARGLESFFLEKATFTSDSGAERAADETAQANDRYVWEWRHGHALDGVIYNVVPDRSMAFTFGGMEAEVRLAEVGDQTEVVVRQWSIPNNDEGRASGHLNCRSCWIFFLTNLQSVLEHGKDLRNDDPERVSSMEIGFQPLSGC
jgi:uncharacterized protein YndB with AHSA1/START domain